MTKWTSIKTEEAIFSDIIAPNADGLDLESEELRRRLMNKILMTCTKHGGLSIDGVYVSRRARNNQFYYTCRVCKISRARNYAKDPKAHKKINARQKEYQRKQAKNLSDGYIRTNLISHGFTKEEITPALIELQRNNIKAKRLERKNG